MTAEQKHFSNKEGAKKKKINPSQDRANPENRSSRKLPMLEKGQIKQCRAEVMVFPVYQVILSSS